jgi:Short-chain alcohol dehydrogenase of unknown specificity
MTMVTDVAEDSFGHLDIVLLNAGMTAGQSGVESLDLDAYRRIMGVNVDHVVYGLCAAVPALRRAGGGSIIATASLAGLMPMSGDPIYTLTKHAVVGYVRSVAPLLVDDGIRVAAVCPGFADTPLIAHAKEQFGDFPLLTADDVANAIEQILDRGEAGECWYVQPGREPAPYGFRGVPGPRAGRPRRRVVGGPLMWGWQVRELGEPFDVLTWTELPDPRAGPRPGAGAGARRGLQLPRHPGLPGQVPGEAAAAVHSRDRDRR